MVMVAVAESAVMLLRRRFRLVVGTGRPLSSAVGYAYRSPWFFPTWVLSRWWMVIFRFIAARLRLFVVAAAAGGLALLDAVEAHHWGDGTARIEVAAPENHPLVAIRNELYYQGSIFLFCACAALSPQQLCRQA